MSMICAVETITREVAVDYLSAKGTNRPLNEGHLNNLANRQRRGEWIANGDTIRFDDEGLLRDGQHRLEMVIRTGMSIESIVVRGIDSKAFVTMDTGRSRTLGDVLSITGYEHSTHLAGALRYVYGFLRGGSKSSSETSHEQHAKTLEKHKGLIDSVSFYLGLERPAGAPGFLAQAIATHYLFSQISPEAANDFTECLVTGLRLTDVSDPIARLRGQLVSYAGKRALKPNDTQVFRLFLLAWNAKQAGRPQKVAYKIPIFAPVMRGFPKDLLEVGQQELEEIDDAEEREQMLT